MSKLATIKEILGYIIVGSVCLYFYPKADQGSFISVILLLSFISCLLLSITAFKLGFRSKKRFNKGDVLVPSELNLEYDDEDNLVVLHLIDNQYLCQHGSLTKYIRFGDEKQWIVKPK